jgi:peptidyl-prolyl cis-trans isomerase SDCCAG10
MTVLLLCCTACNLCCRQVREDIDHRSYMPAAWRVDAYLNEEGEDDDDLASLRQHK